MTSLATDLGIDKSLFFHGHADHATAGDAAKAGEARQFDAMKRDADFLLLGKDWAKTRAERYQHPTVPFADRDAELRMAFPSVFETLHRIERTTVEELLTENLDMETRLELEVVRRRKIEALQAAFAQEVFGGTDRGSNGVGIADSSEIWAAQHANGADAPLSTRRRAAHSPR